MNKAQLVEAVAEQLGGRRAAAEAVDAVLDTIVRAVTAGDRVSVTGFGTFEKVDRSARFARNPQTGERVKVKKTAVPRFRPGQGFKDLVSGSKKLPKTGPSVKKAPKGSLTPGKSGMTAPAGSPAAKKAAAAKKTTVKKATATVKKAAAVKRTTAAAATKKTATSPVKAAAKATAAKTAAKRTPAKKAATTAAKKTTAKKTSAAVKSPAKKTVTASATRPAVRKATTAAKKTTAAAAKKAPAKRVAKKV